MIDRSYYGSDDQVTQLKDALAKANTLIQAQRKLINYQRMLIKKYDMEHKDGRQGAEDDKSA